MRKKQKNKGLTQSSLAVAEDSSMDVPEDDGPAKPYETPPPSASGVATRCEMPAQPQVDNLC